jgi:hypothetical protein
MLNAKTREIRQVTWAQVLRSVNSLLGNGRVDIREALFLLVKEQLVKSAELESAVVDKFRHDIICHLFRLAHGEEVIKPIDTFVKLARGKRLNRIDTSKMDPSTNHTLFIDDTDIAIFDNSIEVDTSFASPTHSATDTADEKTPEFCWESKYCLHGKNGKQIPRSACSRCNDCGHGKVPTYCVSPHIPI